MSANPTQQEMTNEYFKSVRKVLINHGIVSGRWANHPYVIAVAIADLMTWQADDEPECVAELREKGLIPE